MEHSGSKEGCQFALRWVFQGFSFPGTTFNLKMSLKMSGRVYQLVISTILHVSKLFGLSAGFPLELVYPWSPHLSVQFCFCWPAVGLGPTSQPTSQPAMPPNPFLFLLLLVSQVENFLFKNTTTQVEPNTYVSVSICLDQNKFREIFTI